VQQPYNNMQNDYPGTVMFLVSIHSFYGACSRMFTNL